MVDTETILNKLGIPFEFKGGNQLLGLCPFHNDHNYSLSIQKDPLLYHCFACGAKGNWYSLIQNLTGENPYKFLNIEKEIKVDFSFNSSLKLFNSKRKEVKKEESPSFKIVASIYHPFEKEISKAYCLKRGITEEDISKYEIVFIERGYINNTNYFNRLVIPIKDKNNIIISYEGRDVTGSAVKKCIYPYLSKVGNTIFQNSFLDRSKPTIFVEGIMDLITVKQSLPQVQVSTYFGIQLSNNQIKIVKEFSKIITMFDPDEAGIERGNLILEKSIDHKFEICILPNNDPNESTNLEVIEAYEKRISLVEFHLINNDLLQSKELTW